MLLSSISPKRIIATMPPPYMRLGGFVLPTHTGIPTPDSLLKSGTFLHTIRRASLLVILLLGLCSTMGWAQSKKDKLQQEKSAAQKRINEVQQILEQTSVKRKTSTGQLNALSKQIEAHSTLINSISAELNFLQSQITQDNVVINALENDLVNLKKEYGAMVYAAYKSHNSYDKLTFLFSSKTFNQLVMRLKYMEQYSKARKAQVRLIGQVKEKLVAERKGLEERRAERSSLLAEQQSKNQKLLTLRKQENKMLGELKSRESELKKEIAQKKDDVARLEKMIASIISAEIKKTATAENKSPAVEIDLSNITASFEKNKANLPWPVNSGFISEHFGTHPHPVYKRIKVPNDGVNIQTKQNEKVRAVFKGTVKKVAVIPGMKYVVIVQHGNYFTVYARLREVSVKMGQEIEINDEIGEVNTDKDGVTEIQFQVWKNTTKLDPELWLAKR